MWTFDISGVAGGEKYSGLLIGDKSAEIWKNKINRFDFCINKIIEDTCSLSRALEILDTNLDHHIRFVIIQATHYEFMEENEDGYESAVKTNPVVEVYEKIRNTVRDMKVRYPNVTILWFVPMVADYRNKLAVKTEMKDLSAAAQTARLASIDKFVNYAEQLCTVLKKNPSIKFYSIEKETREQTFTNAMLDLIQQYGWCIDCLIHC